MTGEVDRHQRTIERERDGVPRVRVLRPAVEQDDLRSAVTPDERAQGAVAGYGNPNSFDHRRSRPREVELLGVLVEQGELVVGHGHGG